MSQEASQGLTDKCLREGVCSVIHEANSFTEEGWPVWSGQFIPVMLARDLRRAADDDCEIMANAPGEVLAPCLGEGYVRASKRSRIVCQPLLADSLGASSRPMSALLEKPMTGTASASATSLTERVQQPQ